MKIEYALRLCGPKSVSLSECKEPSPRYAYPQRRQQTAKGASSRAGALGSQSDVLLALAITQSHEALGLSLIYAKYNKDPGERNKAIEGIARYALSQAPKIISSAAGRRLAHCMVLLAKMAVEAYSRTPEDKAARCRCGGRGRVVDQAATRAAGATVEKVCPRCRGTGLKPLTSSSAYKVINTLIPELTQRTWSRNWKVFYQSLITRCYQEAASAESFFEQIT